MSLRSILPSRRRCWRVERENFPENDQSAKIEQVVASEKRDILHELERIYAR
jgi:hypothetical protein